MISMPRRARRPHERPLAGEEVLRKTHATRSRWPAGRGATPAGRGVGARLAGHSTTGGLVVVFQRAETGVGLEPRSVLAGNAAKSP